MEKTGKPVGPARPVRAGMSVSTGAGTVGFRAFYEEQGLRGFPFVEDPRGVLPTVTRRLDKFNGAMRWMRLVQ